MLLKELVLTGLESTQEYSLNEEPMTEEMFEANADKEVASWCVYYEPEARFKYYIEVTLED